VYKVFNVTSVKEGGGIVYVAIAIKEKISHFREEITSNAPCIV